MRTMRLVDVEIPPPPLRVPASSPIVRRARASFRFDRKRQSVRKKTYTSLSHPGMPIIIGKIRSRRARGIIAGRSRCDTRDFSRALNSRERIPRPTSRDDPESWFLPASLFPSLFRSLSLSLSQPSKPCRLLMNSCCFEAVVPEGRTRRIPAESIITDSKLKPKIQKGAFSAVLVSQRV